MSHTLPFSLTQPVDAHLLQFADSLPTFRGSDPDIGGSEFYSVSG
jgi:hypothetical protein